MLSKFPRWTSRVQWGFIPVRSNEKPFNENETPRVVSSWTMNIPRPMGVHSQILVNTIQRDEFNSINLREIIRSAECNRKSTVKKVIAEMNIIPRPMGVHSQAAVSTENNEKALPDWNLRETRKSPRVLYRVKVKLVQCFSNEKANAKAKAIWVCKRPILFYLQRLSLPPLVRENEEWNVKISFLEKGPLVVPRILRKSTRSPCVPVS